MCDHVAAYWRFKVHVLKTGNAEVMKEDLRVIRTKY